MTDHVFHEAPDVQVRLHSLHAAEHAPILERCGAEPANAETRRRIRPHSVGPRAQRLHVGATGCALDDLLEIACRV